MQLIKHSEQSVTVHPKMKPNDYFYLVGMTKPRYPMPAIRNVIEIFPDRVILWDATFWNFYYLAER